MFIVSDLSTGQVSEVNFEELKRKVGEDISEYYYTKAFRTHVLTGKTGQIVISEGYHD